MLESLTKVTVSKDLRAQIWSKEVYSAQVVFSALAGRHVSTRRSASSATRDRRRGREGGAGDRRANGIDVAGFRFLRSRQLPPKTAADTSEAPRQRQPRNLAPEEGPGRQADPRFKKKGSGIWWDIVYRKRPSEVRSSKSKLIAYGKKAGADTRLNVETTCR